MKKTGKFFIKKYQKEENKIVLEEEKKYHNPFIIFLINNGKLIFTISLLLSVAVFIIAVSLSLNDIGESSIVMYESDGVVVAFKETDNSIINGTPITKEYAEKVFYSNIHEDNYLKGVVIRLDQKVINGNTYMYYSDKTIIIKYKDGSFKKIYPLNSNYAINKDNYIESSTITKELTGEYQKNTKYNIDIIYLSDGSIIIEKDNINIYVRNSDITNKDYLYTNLSGVSILVNKDNNKYYYSNGIIKENNYIIVDDIKYLKVDTKKINNNIEIIYYDNDYAEIIYNNQSIMVEKKEHISYKNNILEIIDNNKTEENIDIKDIMNMKNITIKNTNNKKENYMIVLEETKNYNKYNINKILDTKYINYNIHVNGNIIKNKVLDNKIKINSSNKTNYLIYEGEIDRLSEITLDIGMWISYENITNEYMNSGFIGTMKVYVESK